MSWRGRPIRKGAPPSHPRERASERSEDDDNRPRSGPSSMSSERKEFLDGFAISRTRQRVRRWERTWESAGIERRPRVTMIDALPTRQRPRMNDQRHRRRCKYGAHFAPYFPFSKIPNK